VLLMEKRGCDPDLISYLDLCAQCSCQISSLDDSKLQCANYQLFLPAIMRLRRSCPAPGGTRCIARESVSRSQPPAFLGSCSPALKQSSQNVPGAPPAQKSYDLFRYRHVPLTPIIAIYSHIDKKSILGNIGYIPLVVLIAHLPQKSAEV
jgi:hypothetical protein